MKFFACLIALAAIATIVMADMKPTDKKDGLLGSHYGGGGGSSYSAPPCPKSYLFSCQPSLAPVPCAAGGGGGYSGAYSQYVPQYALPQQQYNQYQQYLPQY
ncbi:vitelline membrane protein Vm26Aa-like [Episyrphus balteatus]|uniref:vitelline membrane protein Vm26Aa-like n=1 Tax=Episyrphus balteatus TaxID=286459 RepID=UPI002485AFD2|nr:vitelline membrane protein Vm26Aa-like [Episyrphus balteatus]